MLAKSLMTPRLLLSPLVLFLFALASLSAVAQTTVGPFTASFSGLVYNRATNTFNSVLTLINNGPALYAPFSVTIATGSPSVTVSGANGEGTLSLSSIPITVIEPNEHLSLTVGFVNPTRVAFRPTVTAVDGDATPNVPGAPTGVKAAAGFAQVTVTWSAVIGATSYNVYRSTIPGVEGSRIGSSTSTTYTDTTGIVGTTYYYEVTAVDAVGEGAASVQSAAVTFSPAQGTITILHSFGTPNDGTIDQFSAFPSGIIQASDGNLYGTTAYGGTNGFGMVYKITPTGNESVIYSFAGGLAGGADGISPGGLIEGRDGNFYGTTSGGGTDGVGTVFKVTAAGVETVLYSFKKNGVDGEFPSGLIEGGDGNFYGITESGGGITNQSGSPGTIFQITPTGVETVLHAFGSGSDGQSPLSLILGRDGNFYGITLYGGTNGTGTVYKMTPTGTETVLYSFVAAFTGEVFTEGSLIQASDGSLYGIAPYELEANSYGDIFKIAPNGDESTIHSFAVDSADTNGGAPSSLILGEDGTLYGTTSGFGADSGGVFFQISPSGVYSLIYTFNSGPTAGSNGIGALGLIQGSDGHFYGVTTEGGTYGEGTAFQIF